VPYTVYPDAGVPYTFSCWIGIVRVLFGTRASPVQQRGEAQMYELAIILIAALIYTSLLSVALVFLETIANPDDRRYLATQIRKLWSRLRGVRNKRV
jgi:hypothetical protein